MAKRMPKLGTLSHYKNSLDALDEARAALVASGADLDLVEAFEEATYTEALSQFICDYGRGDNGPARRERSRRARVAQKPWLEDNDGDDAIE